MIKIADPLDSEVSPGQGIYDLVEAARIIHRHPDTIARWVGGADPLHPIKHDRILTFLDLVSLWVISELRRRKVPLKDIRAGREYLTEQVKSPYPFAHRDLATVGAGFFGKLDGWIDVGKGGQRAFPEIIEDLLSPLDYGPDLHASLWRPSEGVSLNPQIQAGAPCIEGTRVPTKVVADLTKLGNHIEDIADDLRLETQQVQNALEYERAA